MHARRNIISRNIISHIAVMTLGRYVDYTVGKQQPADWVSILPYITSPHSSLCFFFIALIFPNHFPLPQFPGRGSRLCKQVMWSNMMMGRHNNARKEKARSREQLLLLFVVTCLNGRQSLVVGWQHVNLCANTKGLMNI